MTQSTAMTRFVKNAEAIRQQRGLSIQALADSIGMLRPQLSNVLSGKHSPTLDTMERIAIGLGVDVLDLLSLSEQKHQLATPA
jgi:transcriptional regulator with XRE-family HTH domain